MSEPKKPVAAPKARAKRATKPKKAEPKTGATIENSDSELKASEMDQEAAAVETKESVSASQREISSLAQPSHHSKSGETAKSDELPKSGETEKDGVKVSYKPSDFYLTQVYFDRGLNQFVAFCLELPELKVTAGTKDQAYKDLERKIEGHMASLRNRGDNAPEAFFAKQYPNKLEVPLSQALYRRLDLLSRHEKQSLEALVVELLTVAMDKRNAPGRSGGGAHSQNRPDRQAQDRDHRDRDRERDRDNRGNRNSHQQHHRGGQSQRRQPQGRGYHESLENRENFLEYVRNLEKSGGGSGWRKK